MSAAVLEAPVKERRLRVIRPSLPQVNLLPPEVHAARGLRALKRTLALATVALVAGCAGAYTLATFEVAEADTELAAEQSETARLQGEEQQYAEVPQVLGALDRAVGARALGMSTEVAWTDYLGAITAVLPADVSLESLTVTGATPMLAPAPATDPLQAPSVGQVQFAGRTATVPDTAEWIDALNSVPGFSDAWVSGVSVTETEGVRYYTVESTVQFTESAYANRFGAESEKSHG